MNRYAVSIKEVQLSSDNSFVEMIPQKIISGREYFEEETFFTDKGSYERVEEGINGDMYGFPIDEEELVNYYGLPIEECTDQYFKEILNSRYFLKSDAKGDSILYSLRFDKDDIYIMKVDESKSLFDSEINQELFVSSDIPFFDIVNKVDPVFSAAIIMAVYDRDVNSVKSDKKDDVLEQIDQTEFDDGISLKWTDLPPRKRVADKIKKTYFGQDEGIDKLLRVFYNNHNYMTFSGKHSNILIQGNSGVGKTGIVTAICEELSLPYVIANATSFTSAGYVGGDIESIFTRLVESAGGDIEKASQGIVFLDEFDKLATKAGESGVATTRVQEELLGIIGDRKSVSYKVLNEAGHYVDSGKTIDTTNITFVLAGAYEGILDHLKKNRVGFSSEEDKKKEIRKPNPKDIVKFGTTSQIVRRVPILITLNDLSKDVLREILLYSEGGSLGVNVSVFAKVHGVALKLSDDAIEPMLEKAMLYEGAAGIQSVVEDCVGVALERVEDNPRVYREAIITAETVGDPSKCILVKKMVHKTRAVSATNVAVQ